MKKKVNFLKKIWYKIILTLILVVFLSVGLTSAYLTDSKTKDNTLTIGHLEIYRIHVYFEKQGAITSTKFVSL